ncbi:hypothetical protein FWF93_02655 [Candidatus Saccharibacteria bacterium]|nr:hypothetical protein [Candidatus Saccharibacteria bacterium]
MQNFKELISSSKSEFEVMEKATEIIESEIEEITAMLNEEKMCHSCAWLIERIKGGKKNLTVLKNAYSIKKPKSKEQISKWLKTYEKLLRKAVERKNAVSRKKQPYKRANPAYSTVR